MPAYLVRIFANACITRYNTGEADIVTIVESYNLPAEEAAAILAEIHVKRPDIAV